MEGGWALQTAAPWKLALRHCYSPVSPAPAVYRLAWTYWCEMWMNVWYVRGGKESALCEEILILGGLLCWAERFFCSLLAAVWTSVYNQVPYRDMGSLQGSSQPGSAGHIIHLWWGHLLIPLRKWLNPTKQELGLPVGCHGPWLRTDHC